jgi:hypothetical protein
LTDAEKTAIKDAFQRCFMAMSAVPGASCYGKSGSHAQNILTSLDTLFTQSHTESEWHIITNELEICALTRRDGGCQDRLNVLLLGMHTCVILAGTSILQSPHLVVTTLRAQYLYELIEEFIRTVFSNYVALTNNRSDEALEASLVLHCIIMRLYPDIAKELPQCMTHAECGWSILQNICDEKFFKSDKNPAIVECFGKRCVDMAAAFKSLEDAEKIDAEIDGIAESFNWMTKNSIATVIKSVLYFVSGQMNKNFNGIMAQYAKTMRINDEEITPCKCEQYDEIVQSLRENSKILMGVKSYASTHPRAPVTKKIFSAANIDLSSLTFADFEVLWFFCDQKCDEHENDLATQLKYENLRDAIAEYFSQKNTLQSRYIMKLLCKANDELAQPFDHFYLESNWRSVVS